MKRNNTRTLDGKPVVLAVETPTVDTPTVDTPTSNTVATGTVAHDGTPAIIDAPASAALASDAGSKVVTGIPYQGVIRTTGVTYPFKGIRGQIYNMLRDGMVVGDFAKAARAGYRGGIEDVRIYVRKGIAVICDPVSGAQVYPPKPPTVEAPKA